MAQKRVQVGRLNAPTQSDLRPQAAPVETYVRPAKTELQPSELSQFVTAISPAIKADAEMRKAERLKREREIETGQRQIHLSQLEQQGKLIEAELEKDWLLNKQEYLQMNTADVLDKRRTYVESEVEKLRSVGIDPMLIDAFSVDMESLTNVWGKTTYEPAKIDNNKKLSIGKLGESILAQIDLSEQSLKGGKDKNAYQTGSQAINNLVNGFIQANNQYFTKQEVNDYLMNLAHEQRETNPNSALVTWLDSKLSNNQFGIPRHLDKVTDIRKAQASASKINKTAWRNGYKDQWYNSKASNFLDGDVTAAPSGRQETMPDDEGTTWKPNNEDMANYIDNNYNVRMANSLKKLGDIKNNDSLSETEKQAQMDAIQSEEIIPLQSTYYKYYTSTGTVPLDVTQASQVFNSTLVTGNVLAPENTANLKASYEAIDKFTRFGGNLSTLNTDTRNRFMAVQALVDNSVSNLETALVSVQGIAEFDGKLSITDKEIADAIDSGVSGWFTKFTNKEEAVNFNYLADDVKELAPVLRKILPPSVSDEEVVRQAAEKVSKNFIEVESPDGTISVVKQSQLSKRTPAYVENLEQGLRDVMENRDLVAYIHNEMGIEPRYIMTDGSVVAGRSQLAEARRNGLSVRSIDDAAQFTLSISHHTGNENLVYLKATAKDGTSHKALAYVNLHEFDKMRLQGIKQQYVTKFEDAVNEGLITPEEFSPEAMAAYEDLGADTIGPQGEDFGQVEITGGGAPTVTDYEALVGLTGQDDRRVARESLLSYMEEQRQDLLDRARQKAQENGVNPEAVDAASDSIFQSIFDSIGEGFNSLFGADEAGAAEPVPSETSTPTPAVVTPSEVASRTFSDKSTDTTTVQGDTVQVKAANLIKGQEDFRAVPYKDGKNKSVGYGFYIPSLEADEKALIKDINNITQQEADAVIELKVRKITDFMTNEVNGFTNLPDNTQMAITSMAFQLGRQNVRDEWPKFMTAIKKAASLPTNSAQQRKALEEASMHMLFNVKGNSKTATSWSKQTPNRAREMAEAIKG